MAAQAVKLGEQQENGVLYAGYWYGRGCWQSECWIWAVSVLARAGILKEGGSGCESGDFLRILRQ